MATQNYKNHGRYIPLWHIVTSLLLIGMLGGSIVNLINTSHEANMVAHYSAALLVVASFVLLLIFWYARWFALRAQDRAIRAEENFRHFVLTGKPLDSKLRLSQIIALRFASDAEFPDLAKKAVAENMSQKDIKLAVQNWRADYHRV